MMQQPGMMPMNTSMTSTTNVNITNIVNEDNISEISHRSGAESDHKDNTEVAVAEAPTDGKTTLFIVLGIFCCLVLIGGAVGGGMAGGGFSAIGLGGKANTVKAKIAANMLLPFQIKYSETFYPLVKNFHFKKTNGVRRMLKSTKKKTTTKDVDVEVCTGTSCNKYRGK